MQNALPILDFEFMQCLVCYYDVGVAATATAATAAHFRFRGRLEIKKLFRTQSLRSRVKAMPSTAIEAVLG